MEIKENEKEDVSCAIKKRGGLLAKEECDELIKISSGNVSLFLQLIELDSETFEAVKQIYDSSYIITKDIIDTQTKTILELRTIKFNRIKELAKGSSGVAGKLNTLEPEEFEKVQRLFPLLRVKIDTNIIDAIKNSPRTLTDENCEEIKKIARGNTEVAARLISLTQEKFQEVQRLSALNIYINADIIDAIKNRPQALTDDDCEEIKKIARGDFEVTTQLISLTQEKFQEIQRLSALKIYINADIIDAIKNSPRTLTEADCEEIKKIARGNSEVAARLISLTQEKFQEVQRLSALNIYISADIIDAIKNRPQTLTEADCEEIKKYEEALTLLPNNFSLFAAFIKKPTEDWPAFQAFLERVERHCAAVLEIAQSFTNIATLNKDDMIAISKALLSKRELSPYELLDFARVAIKRESCWTFALTFMDPDSFLAIYEHHRRDSQLLPTKKTFR